jgi:hypothetical protein
MFSRSAHVVFVDGTVKAQKAGDLRTLAIIASMEDTGL